MSQQVDFYVLPANIPRDNFICRIIDKAYNQNKKIHLHVANQTQAQQFDELLWTFRDTSFIPHALYASDSEQAAVEIGWDPEKSNHQEIVINLTDAIPEIAWLADRVIECVTTENKTLARQHFKTYREKGLQVQSHNISK